jgi:hypothetical protein
MTQLLPVSRKPMSLNDYTAADSAHLLSATQRIMNYDIHVKVLFVYVCIILQ